jgi:alkylation response protein AidB-like acyl-CoA dehydrogenase
LAHPACISAPAVDCTIVAGGYSRAPEKRVDFGFSPEQDMLRAAARKLLDTECPPTLVRAMLADATAHHPALWRHLADLGALGILIPDDAGGQGGSFLDLVVLLEEMGKSLLPGPFFATTLLGALALTLAGSAPQRRAWLPALASGERLATLTLDADQGEIAPTAERTADGYRVRGTQAFVMDAHVADTLVVAARAAAGTTLFVLDARTQGVEVTPLRTVDMSRRLATVRLDVTLPLTAMLGSEGGGTPIVQRVLQHARAGLAVEAVGVAQRALDLAVAYANERKQFGRPIGSFQAVKHKCVDMMVGVETARSLAYYAAWAVSENAADAEAAVAMAKAYAGDVAKAVTSEAIQVHGGIGFTWEHDIHLYHRRALAIAAAFGSAVEHRETVARTMIR